MNKNLGEKIGTFEHIITKGVCIETYVDFYNDGGKINLQIYHSNPHYEYCRKFYNWKGVKFPADKRFRLVWENDYKEFYEKIANEITKIRNKIQEG